MNYRTRTIKRSRRTKAEIEGLDEQIYDELAVDNPQSVRHVFYRMTDPRLAFPVDKTDGGYRTVQDRLQKLRRAGVVPYRWIADTSRRGYHVDTFSGAGDFLRRTMGLYRSDLWANSDYYCEVWVESRSLASVIQDDCEELAVSLYPSGGFASISFTFEAASLMNEVVSDRVAVVYYIGDYDPAGVLIDVSIERELREHLDPRVDLRFIRLGITPEQIEAYDLPTKPRKAGDQRSLHIETTVEAESMPSRIMRRLLRENVEDLLPEGALEVARVAEESERSLLSIMAGAVE